MRDENEQFAGTKISHETLVPYKQLRKPIVSAVEREKERKSLKKWTIGGDGQ